ncbi:MAG: oxygen-independent coproporphyrinogen III oxidase [Cytophagaceae bacterium]|nr:oxygen-independent coproporphyrinogen III oxidase [Cytophagaceae bacterium]
MKTLETNLIEKYNVPGPRYTSYPTVPYWENNIKNDRWKKLVRESFKAHNESEGLSLYIHLPYCESLCTYCGCNTRITINHTVELPYISTVLKEWSQYLLLFERIPVIKEIHIGGGTPTFFKPENLEILMRGILEKSILHPKAELSFEAHPNSTSKKHLETLFNLGFRRLSLGIQDFDPKVQEICNRQQSFETVENVTLQARSMGYTSINFDLLYGLPYQTLNTISDTIEKVNLLKPDRIAFYSYAHVPWLKPSQKIFERYLPGSDVKRSLYEKGRELLEQSGYLEIGMDHFALESDSLYHAAQNKTLHRNFMGYTCNHTHMLIGLGASSISDTWTGFMQNIKTVETYMSYINNRILPIHKGHELNTEDLILRKHILNIMCKMETRWDQVEDQTPDLFNCLLRLEEMEKDNLIQIDNFSLKVLPEGKPFLRNICMAFDERMWKNVPQTQIFSNTI